MKLRKWVLPVVVFLVTVLVCVAVLPSKAEADAIKIYYDGGYYTYCVNSGGITILDCNISNTVTRGKSLEIPKTLCGYPVTVIDEAAFSGSAAEHIIIPQTVTEIGDYAFAGCKYLKEITIPDSVTKIGYEAFAECVTLRTVTLGKGLTKISGALFSGCTNLKSITIHKGVKTISGEAFLGCGKLKDIYFFGARSLWKSIKVSAPDPEMTKATLHLCTSNGTCDLCGVRKVMIAKQPKETVTEHGKEARVAFRATGDELTYRWYFADEGKKAFSATTAFKGTAYSVTMNNQRANRKVFCVVTDKYGNSITTDAVKLSCFARITEHPTSIVVKNNAAAYVKVEAKGEGLTYQWYFRNKGGKKYYIAEGFTTNYYNVRMTEKRDGTQVYCVVTDKFGNSVKSKVARLNGDPKITPASVTEKSGTEVKLTVSAKGYGLSYQWQVKTPSGKWKNTTTRGYKTETLTVSATKARNGYQYRCIVSDKSGGGDRISSAATLKVK